MRNVPISVSEYIDAAPAQARKRLREMRALIAAAAPGATQSLKWRMPAFSYERILVTFAAFREHISLFPTPSAIRAFRADLAKYKTSAGTVQFPLDKPLPMTVASGFYGLHIGHFAGPTLRWLYFICGLAGTAMIGTGLVIWLGKRQLKHARSGVMPFELRLVEVLNIASMPLLVPDAAQPARFCGGGGVLLEQSSVAAELERAGRLGSERVLHRLGFERAARFAAPGTQGLGRATDIGGSVVHCAAVAQCVEHRASPRRLADAR